MISKNGDSYDTYTKTTLTDTNGNTLYKYIDSDNNSHYIAAVADKDKDTTSYYDVTESDRGQLIRTLMARSLKQYLQ